MNLGASAAAPRRVSDRFLLYSHDGLGLGHFRRNLAIAGALTELAPTASVLLATGVEEAETPGIPPRVDLLRLPGLRKLGNEAYAPRRLRMEWKEFAAIRGRILAAALESLRPAVFLADRHPLGPGRELVPTLEAARSAGIRAALGLRDILDEPAIVAGELSASGIFEQIPRYYDRVLVYGQPEIFDPVRAYGFPRQVAELTRYCGYVYRPPGGIVRIEDGSRWPGRPPRDRPLVLATAGGGEDGFALLSSFVHAVAGLPWEAVIVSGPQCDREEAKLLHRVAAEADVAFFRYVPGLSSAFGLLDALVCMGGYNTLIEAVAAGVPTVCVPRIRPRREQLLRARAFAELGLLTLLEPQRLEPMVLREAIQKALDPSQVAPNRGTGSTLDLQGAWRAARFLLRLARRGAVPRRAEVGVALR